MPLDIRRNEHFPSRWIGHSGPMAHKIFQSQPFELFLFGVSLMTRSTQRLHKTLTKLEKELTQQY